MVVVDYVDWVDFVDWVQDSNCPAALLRLPLKAAACSACTKGGCKILSQKVLPSALESCLELLFPACLRLPSLLSNILQTAWVDYYIDGLSAQHVFFKNSYLLTIELGIDINHLMKGKGCCYTLNVASSTRLWNTKLRQNLARTAQSIRI